MSVIIREPKKNEIHILADLSCELLMFNRQHDPKEHDLQVILEARRKRVFTYWEQASPNQLFLLAMVDEEPAGFIRAQIMETDLATDVIEPFKGSIDEVFVRDPYRSLGLGKKLMDEAIQWMKRRNVNFVTLEMYAWNNGAYKFYEKEKFQICDIIWGKKI